MKSLSGSMEGIRLIWVRANEEDSAQFVYRAVGTDGQSPLCYGNPQYDARQNWVILSSSPLALGPCDNEDAPADAGTLYTLRRA